MHKRDLISKILHKWATSLDFSRRIFAWASSQREAFPHPVPVYHYHGVSRRHINSTFNTVTNLSTGPLSCRWWPIFTKWFKPKHNVVWLVLLSFLFGAYWTRWIIPVSLWSWLVKTFSVKDVLTRKHSCDWHVLVSYDGPWTTRRFLRDVSVTQTAYKCTWSCSLRFGRVMIIPSKNNIHRINAACSPAAPTASIRRVRCCSSSITRMYRMNRFRQEKSPVWEVAVRFRVTNVRTRR